jgi:hypothetical protein
MGRRGYLLAALMLVATARACAQDADAILGKWLN